MNKSVIVGIGIAVVIVAIGIVVGVSQLSETNETEIVQEPTEGGGKTISITIDDNVGITDSP